MSGIVIRPVEQRDNPQIAAIIRRVMPEFGASGPGFAINDPEVDGMYEAYQTPGSKFFVIEEGSRILGIGGVGPLKGDAGSICELQKMYFLPELRGKGYGRKMIEKILEVARELGYSQCYLETLSGMNAAQHLYEEFGFVQIDHRSEEH